MIGPIMLVAACGMASSQLPAAPNAVPAAVGMRQPALSSDGKRLAFALHGDLWVAPVGGGMSDRVTVHPAYDGYPAWSPDGRWLAFSSRREGNFDVYLVPARGGEPVRKTWHPADDFVCDWSPDGRAILFSSARDRGIADLYAVGVEDGLVRRVTHEGGGARHGRYSADGSTVAFTSGAQEWWQAAHNGRGRAAVRTIRLDTRKVVTVSEGMGYRAMPAAGARGLYCVGFENGRYDIRRGTWQPSAWRGIGEAGAEPISWLTCARGAEVLVFERGGRLWLLDGSEGGKPIALTVRAPSDARTMPIARARRTGGFTEVRLSPDGKTFAVVSDGDIWTAPVAGGDATRLTTTRGPESAPCWSPDSKRLAFLAVRGERSDVFVVDVSDRRETRVTDDDVIEIEPRFSPDGQRLAYVRSDGPEPGLVVHYLGAPAAEPLGPTTLVWRGPRIAGHDWSPDGRWLAFSASRSGETRDVWIVPSTGGTAANVTRAAGDLRRPRWSRDGVAVACTGSLWMAGDLAETGVVIVRLNENASADQATRTASSRGPVGSPGGAEQGGVRDDDPVSQRRRRPPAGPSAPPSPGESPPSGPWPMGPPITPTGRVTITFDGIAERVALAAPAPPPVGEVVVAPDGRTLLFAVGSGAEAWLAAADSRSRAGLRMGDATGIAGDIQVAPDASAVYWRTASGSIGTLQRGSAVSSTITIVCVSEQDRREVVAGSVADAWRNLRGARAATGALRIAEETALGSDAPEDVAAAILAMAVASGTWVREVRADPISDDTGYLDLQFDADYPGPGLRVADVLPGGATSRMALAPAAGEYIHTIDGRAINKPEEVWDVLRARAGREASLVVAPTPPGDAAEVTPGLRTLHVPLLGQAGYRRLEEAAWSGEQAARLAKLTSGVARYVRLRGFGDQEMRRFAADLRWDPSGVRVLVVDMRDLDGEGDPARALPVLLDRRLSGVVGDLVPAPARLPLVLLVNERASGCAEALAIVLQASGQAKVVGAPTAGLAWVTRSHRLPCGLTLVAADAAYCEQGGRSLAGRHVEPDLAAPDSGAQLAEAAAVALRLAAEGSNAPPRD